MNKEQPTIKIEQDTAGYSEGTYGYVITAGSKAWANGGYPSAKLAESAARKHIGRLRRDGLIRD